MTFTESSRQARFEKAWSAVFDEILDDFKAFGMPKDAQEYYARNLNYNVPGGKMNRGMSVIDTAEILKNRPLTDEEYHQAAVLGWCVELLQACFLVSDDLMDACITRRGKPCYYRIPSVGRVSVNDACMLEGVIFRLLKPHFRKEPYYTELIELFHETAYRTEMGQLLDLITAPQGTVDLSKFSLQRHRLIVIYKTAFYSFYLPVALAMLFCSVPTSYTLSSSPSPIKPYEVAKSILLPLGEYFQVQDDFLDFAGTPEQIGKIGTDIVDNKCSWCINTAITAATPEQRKILDANYGVKPVKGETGQEQNPTDLGEAERRVKKVFEEVGLRQKYIEYEEKTHARLTKMIEEIDEGSPGQDGVLKKAVFTTFLEKIYQRRK